jgi:large subunit ribosomal protein L25
MEISAKKRELLGRKTKNLRKQGLLPAVLYSRESSVSGKDVLNLSLNAEEFKKIYREVGTSALIKLNIEDGKKANILISQVQFDAVTLNPIHASLFEVDMKEEIETDIPVNIINGEENDLVKSGEGIVILLQSNIKVKCLPANIPHEFVVDALTFKAVGDVFKVSDLKIDASKVEILIDAEEAIAKMDFAQQLEVEEDTPMSIDQIEVTSEKKDEPKDGDSDKDN